MDRTKKQWRAFAADLAPASADESLAVSRVIAEVLRRDALRVALTFLAMPGEIDLGPLTEEPNLILATTRTPGQGPLTMHPLEVEMETHPFGYLQPKAGSPEIDPGSLEVILVPGVLFTRRGARLGHGRGYYDGLLSSLPGRPLTIGATVERRVVPDLPMSESDVWMDAIATELGYWESRG